MDHAHSAVQEKGIPAHLAPLHEHIVVGSADSLDAEPLQSLAEGLQIACKNALYGSAFRDMAQHEVPFIGINASSPALTPVNLHAVGLAELEIHLGLHILIASYYDRRPALPEEKTATEFTGGELFH